MDLKIFLEDAQRIQMIAKNAVSIEVEKSGDGEISKITLTAGKIGEKDWTYAFLKPDSRDLIRSYTDFVIRAIS